MDERGLPIIVITMALVLAGLLLFILVRDSNSPDPLAPVVGTKAVLTPAQVTQLQSAARTQDEVLARAQALVNQLAALLAAPLVAAVTTTTTGPATTTTTGSMPTSTTTTTTTTAPARPLDGICRATRLC